MRVLVCLLLLAAGCATNVERGHERRRLEAFSHEGYGKLLARYVDPAGRVDYTRWKATPGDLRELDAYLELVANASPVSRPDLFPSSRETLAYWINAYNALVTRAVLDHWPIASVNDVTSGLGVLRGKGFFADRRYLVGGEWLSLDDLEDRLRAQPDPRIHFAINCASGSCPPLQATEFRPDHLERELDGAARAFVADPKNVQVDAGARVVRLSPIFSWYEEDFLGELPKGSTILDYLVTLAEEPLARALATAKREGFAIVENEYDWGVNDKK